MGSTKTVKPKPAKLPKVQACPRGCGEVVVFPNNNRGLWQWGCDCANSSHLYKTELLAILAANKRAEPTPLMLSPLRVTLKRGDDMITQHELDRIESGINHALDCERGRRNQILIDFRSVFLELKELRNAIGSRSPEAVARLLAWIELNQVLPVDEYAAEQWYEIVAALFPAQEKQDG